MAGTVTVTDYAAKSFGTHKVKFAWTADAAGNASVTTTTDYFGTVYSLVTTPGTPIPLGNYDIQVTDADGYDILQGVGANRGNSTIQYANPGAGSIAFGNLTLSVTNAGNATQGTTIVHILPNR